LLGAATVMGAARPVRVRRSGAERASLSMMRVPESGVAGPGVALVWLMGV
jgi:hypothetical protein